MAGESGAEDAGAGGEAYTEETSGSGADSEDTGDFGGFDAGGFGDF